MLLRDSLKTVPEELVKAIDASCNSDACINARIDLASAEAIYQERCTEVGRKKDKAKDLGIAALAAAAIFIALIHAASAAAASIIGIPVAAVLMVLAIVALIAFVGLLTARIVADGEVRAAQERLDEALRDWMEAQRAVMTNCPSNCWPDLSPPRCQ